MSTEARAGADTRVRGQAEEMEPRRRCRRGGRCRRCWGSIPHCPSTHWWPMLSSALVRSRPGGGGIDRNGTTNQTISGWSSLFRPCTWRRSAEALTAGTVQASPRKSVCCPDPRMVQSWLSGSVNSYIGIKIGKINRAQFASHFQKTSMTKLCRSARLIRTFCAIH